VSVNPALGLVLEGGKLVIDKFGWAFIRVVTDFGLRVEFAYSNLGYVFLPTGLQGMTSGLCGNFNNDYRDELISVNGTDFADVTNGASHYGNTWQVLDLEDPA
jgi:hypothetical protein